MPKRLGLTASRTAESGLYKGQVWGASDWALGPDPSLRGPRTGQSRRLCVSVTARVNTVCCVAVISAHSVTQHQHTPSGVRVWQDSGSLFVTHLNTKALGLMFDKQDAWCRYSLLKGKRCLFRDKYTERSVYWHHCSDIGVNKWFPPFFYLGTRVDVADHNIFRTHVWSCALILESSRAWRFLFNDTSAFPSSRYR